MRALVPCLSAAAASCAYQMEVAPNAPNDVVDAQRLAKLVELELAEVFGLRDLGHVLEYGCDCSYFSYVTAPIPPMGGGWVVRIPVPLRYRGFVRRCARAQGLSGDAD